MPRTANADRILNESAMRLEAARLRETLAQSQLNTAKAVLEAIQQAHTALENALTPKPRKKPERSAPAQKDLPVDKEAICGVCGNTADYQDHFKPSPNFHEFEGPKPVARAPRKSKQKSETANSTANTDVETVTATAVGVSAA